MKNFLFSSGRIPNTGLFLLRLGIGILFIIHGFPKLSGGMETWLGLGSVVNDIGINFGYRFWGFLAAFAEFGGGILLIMGFMYRPACLLLFVTMLMATIHHIVMGDGFIAYSHSMELGIIFLVMMMIGPGKFSVQAVFFSHPKNKKTLIY